MSYITLLMQYKSQCNFENKNWIKLDNERHVEIIKLIFNYVLHTCKINSIMKLCSCINVTKNMTF